jgi:hypothetical protein
MVTFTFDTNNKLLIVDLPDTIVTIQQIVDAVRDWQDEMENMDIEDFISPSGKQDLGGGVYVGITLELLYGWKLKFADRPGPAWVNCYVKGGNLVATGGADPIYSATFTDTIIAQSTSATLLSGGADPSVIADAVWNELLPGLYALGTAGKIVGDNLDTNVSSRSTLTQANIISDATPFAGADITFMRRFFTNKKIWDDVNKEWEIYDDTGVVVLCHWKPHTKAGADVTMPDDAFAASDKVA